MNPLEYKNSTKIGLDFVSDGKRKTTCQLVDNGQAIATADFSNGKLVGHAATWQADLPLFFACCSQLIRQSPIAGYSKCPCCGYYAFNGAECFDCGYRP